MGARTAPYAAPCRVLGQQMRGNTPARLWNILSGRMVSRLAPKRPREGDDLFSASTLSEWLQDQLASEESWCLLLHEGSRSITPQPTLGTPRTPDVEQPLGGCLDEIAAFLE